MAPRGVAARRTLQSPELAFAIGRHSGAVTARTAFAACRGLHEALREALPALLAACPPEVYVLGGESWEPGKKRELLADAERFDPISGRWEAIAPMPRARVDCAAAECGGRLYVLGGENSDGVLDSVDYFDPMRGCWESAPPMLSARFGGAAAACRGVLYALGGRGPGSSMLRASRPSVQEGLGYRTLDLVERMDLEVGCWEPLPPMPAKREYFGAVARGGRLYAIGGCNDHTFWAMLLSGASMPGLGCDVLNLATGVWEALAFRPPLPTALRRAHHSAVLAVKSPGAGGAPGTGAAAYVVGGYADRLQKVDVAERVDLEEGKWEGMPSPAPLAARAKCAAALSAGCVYVMGGHDGPRYWASGERLDLATSEWVPIPPMSTPRAGCAAAAVRR